MGSTQPTSRHQHFSQVVGLLLNSLLQKIMFSILTLLLLSSFTLATSLDESTDAAKEATNGEFSPDPCFPLCTTDSGLTSPKPERGCVKTDCFDEALCREYEQHHVMTSSTINHHHHLRLMMM